MIGSLSMLIAHTVYAPFASHCGRSSGRGVVGAVAVHPLHHTVGGVVGGVVELGAGVVET